MNPNYEYAAIRQRMLSMLRSRFEGREMITQVEAAQVYGYADSYKAEKAVLCNLPAYRMKGRNKRYAITDIASDLASRAEIPTATGRRRRV